MYTHRTIRGAWLFFTEVKSQLFVRIFLFCVAFWFSAASTALQLNGVAHYQELNNDYYVAALYAEEKQPNAEWWLNSDQEKKMVLLIQAQHWSARSWFKKWQNNLAINNALDTFSDSLQRTLTEFSRLPKGDLISGDQIDIHYIPNNGTRIVINGYQALHAPSSEVFTALVNTWIGKLPPSRLFKQQILSLSVSQDGLVAQKRIEDHQISPVRQKAIVDWYMTPEELAKQVAEKRKREQEKDQARKAELARIQAEKSLEVKLKALQEKRIAEQKRQERLALQKQKEREHQQAQEEKRLALEKTKKEKQLAEEKQKKTKRIALNQKYYKRFYEWQLQSAIRSHITYPEWARKFKEQGLIEARFKINRKGEVTTIHMPGDTPSMLAAEMRQSINQVSGKIKPPRELLGQSWQFSVRHSFKFGSNKQAALVRPRKPVHL